MTLAQEPTSAKTTRSMLRMDCPGIAPPAPRQSGESIGGRDAGWPRRHPEEEEGLEPTIVRGRE